MVFCCFQDRERDRDSDDQDASEKAVVKEETATSRPKPQVFAIMRNGHEVIRGNVLEIQEALDENKPGKAFFSYLNLHKWMQMHKLMEEGNGDGKTPMGVFSVLDDRFDGIATEKKLHNDHKDLEDLEYYLEEAAIAEDKEKFKDVFEEFKTLNESHLQKEEEVMMPRIQELAKNGVDMKQLMKTEVLALVVDSSDFPFFVKHANRILDKYHGDKPRVRVFDHALWACATPKQWKKWRSWIRQSVPESRFQEIREAIEIQYDLGKSAKP